MLSPKPWIPFYGLGALLLYKGALISKAARHMRQGIAIRCNKRRNQPAPVHNPAVKILRRPQLMLQELFACWRKLTKKGVRLDGCSSDDLGKQ